MDLIEKIEESCTWFYTKLDKRGKPVGTISNQVPWVNWEKRIFSPAMIVLWHHYRDEIGNFIIPSSYPDALAKALDVSLTWAESFVYYSNDQSLQEEATINLNTGEIKFNQYRKPFSADEEINASASQCANYFINKYPPLTDSKYSGAKLSKEHATSLNKKVIRDVLDLKASRD